MVDPFLGNIVSPPSLLPFFSRHMACLWADLPLLSREVDFGTAVAASGVHLLFYQPYLASPWGQVTLASTSKREGLPILPENGASLRLCLVGGTSWHSGVSESVCNLVFVHWLSW